MKTVQKVTVTRFSDPMMGLAWECEPALKRVRERFEDAVQIDECMVVLVRDVADFMTPDERRMPEEEGIRTYNERLAQIYLEEEPIAGMPIDMKGFQLFGLGRRSSRPLCLAYEAAKIVCPDKSAEFLYRLRQATVAGCRVTTREDVLLEIADEAGMERSAFRAALVDGRADAMLRQDAAFASSVGIRSLPAFLVTSGERALMLHGLPINGELEDAILELMGTTSDVV